MVSAVRESTIEVKGIIAQVERKLEQHYERTAHLLRSYREDHHRAIMGVYTRLVSIEDTIETDRAARLARQKTLDTQIEVIQYNQRFLVRLAVIAGLVAAGVALGWWLF